jgi:hypothetical protein
MEILCDILLSLILCVCGVYCLHAYSFSNGIYICECFVVVIIIMNIFNHHHVVIIIILTITSIINITIIKF